MKSAPHESESFTGLLEYLQRTRGFDFLAYKRNTLMRRTLKRMETVGIRKFEDYIDYLEVHPEEFSQLFNTMLINVTSFFRDPSAWEFLQQDVVPRLLAETGPTDPLRVWSAGCASGEEAYSLAIVFCEIMGSEAFQRRVKIYASDVDEEALTQARAATYTEAQLDAVPEKLRGKCFVPNSGRFSFRTELRRTVIFGRHDLVQDAPISRLDLLLCRNTLMYLNAETQSKIMARFHFALNDTGVLFLGKAEMLMSHNNLFSPVDVKHRIFAKMPKVNYRDRLMVMAQAGDPDAANHLGRNLRLKESAFETEPTARLVVDASGIVVLVNARMRSEFGLDVKDAGRPLQDLQISYRPMDLRSLMDKARVEKRPVTAPKVERRNADDSVRYYDVEVTPLTGNGEAPVGYSISFLDLTRYNQLQTELERSNQELETANEELQSAHEELETTNEELQSTNEELETTNEELQSTNEELETMNEELSSTNEELETINTELRQRSDELDSTNFFLQSILSSLRSGVVVLDSDLNVLMWNHKAEDLWGLRPEEVRGKPFLDLDIGLPVSRLKPSIEHAMKGAAVEDVYLEAVTRRGKVIDCRVNCVPLEGENGNGVRGVVLTMLERATGKPESAPVRSGNDRNSQRKSSRKAAEKR